MIDLHRFGLNPFEDEEISTDELSDFTVEFLGRATQDTAGGQLNDEIATVATALQNFDVAITSETVKLGVQKARTVAKGNFRGKLANEISRLHGAVVMKFGQDAAELEEYFPEGREVFSECTEGLLDNKLTALRDALQAQETASPGFFHEETLLLANGLVTKWQALHGAATTGRAAHQLTADQRRAAGQALRTELYQAVLKIATIFAGQLTLDGQPRGAERIAHYCPQHLLENAPSGNPQEG